MAVQNMLLTINKFINITNMNLIYAISLLIEPLYTQSIFIKSRKVTLPLLFKWTRLFRYYYLFEVSYLQDHVYRPRSMLNSQTDIHF